MLIIIIIIIITTTTKMPPRTLDVMVTLQTLNICGSVGGKSQDSSFQKKKLYTHIHLY